MKSFHDDFALNDLILALILHTYLKIRPIEAIYKEKIRKLEKIPASPLGAVGRKTFAQHEESFYLFSFFLPSAGRQYIAARHHFQHAALKATFFAAIRVATKYIPYNIRIILGLNRI